MLSGSDDTDLESDYATSSASRPEDHQPNPGLISCIELSFSRVEPVLLRWRNATQFASLQNGRTRPSSGARASGTDDSQPRWRRRSVSRAFGQADLTSARLLRASFRTNRARSNRSGRPPQEALIAIHTHRHTSDRSQPFTPWIHAVSRYKFLDRFRLTKLSFKDLLLEDAHELTSLKDMTAVESSLDLQRLLSEISNKAGDVIQYVKLVGLSVGEAAARGGVSESAIKVALHRGLKALALRDDRRETREY